MKVIFSVLFAGAVGVFLFMQVRGLVLDFKERKAKKESKFNEKQDKI